MANLARPDHLVKTAKFAVRFMREVHVLNCFEVSIVQTPNGVAKFQRAGNCETCSKFQSSSRRKSNLKVLNLLDCKLLPTTTRLVISVQTVYCQSISNVLRVIFYRCGLIVNFELSSWCWSLGCNQLLKERNEMVNFICFCIHKRRSKFRSHDSCAQKPETARAQAELPDQVDLRRNQFITADKSLPL